MKEAVREVDLSFLLPENNVRTVAQVKIGDRTTRLLSVYSLEDLIVLQASCEEVERELAAADDNACTVMERLERLKVKLRRQIITLAPDLDDAWLGEKFVSIDSLRGLFVALLKEVRGTIPEYAKKNSETATTAEATAAAS